MRQTWVTPGGVHPPENKIQSLTQPIGSLPIPEKLVVPLGQHIGAPAIACVKLGDTVLKGQKIADPAGTVSAAIHAPTSGKITAIESRPIAHSSGMDALCVEITTDGKDQWIKKSGISDFEHTSSSALLSIITEAGIAGMGGAGFPTAVKLNPGFQRPIDTLIVNATECEPYITADDSLIRERAEEIVEGIRILSHILGNPQNILIGIEDNKPEAIKALEPHTVDTGINVVSFPTKYPSGGEKQLIHLLTGIEVPSQGLPLDVGILCQNVGTCVAVANAVLEGKPFIDRIVTLTGDALAKPQNVRALIGTSIHELIEHHSGFAKACQRTLMGGPMMGFSLPDIDRPIAKGSNCVLSLHEVEPTQEPQPCIRCGECVKVCPALLLPQQLYWYAKSHNFDQSQDHHLFDCIECGCCAHVCPSKIPLVQYYRFAKTEIWASEREKQQSDLARRRHEFRDARLARLEAERKARLRKKKEVLENKPKAKGDDPKKAAIEAAMKRVAAKKAAQAAEEKSS